MGSVQIVKRDKDDKTSLTTRADGKRVLEFKSTGKPIREERVSQEGVVLFLLDSSGSMSFWEKLEKAKQGIFNFAAEAIKKHHQMGLIIFNSSARVVFKPQKNLSQIQEAMEQIDAEGSTNMTDAIDKAIDAFKPLDCERTIVIATDGYPDNADSALAAGERAKKMGIHIMTIGTDDADIDFLRKLASKNNFAKKVPHENFSQEIASTARQLSDPSKRQLGTGRT